MHQEPDILIDAVKKARIGDRSAGALIYQQFSKAMFNLCIGMTGNSEDAEDAEDVLQEPFVIAFNNLNQLKDDNLFANWAKKIVVSECCKLNKKRFSYAEFTSSEEEEKQEEDSIWLDAVCSKRMDEAIKALPEGYRQIFNLFAVEDYSRKQVAEHLDISESTSKSQYQRARQLLKEHLLKHLSLHG